MGRWGMWWVCRLVCLDSLDIMGLLVYGLTIYVQKTLKAKTKTKKQIPLTLGHL